MLPTRHRLSKSAEFSVTTRSGARTGRRNLVLYVQPTRADQPSRFGFIVSKAVGNAVTRNLVKRRLRALSAESLEEYPCGLDVVVRALPPAATAGWDRLSSDYRHALRGAVERSSTRDVRRPAGRHTGPGKEGTA